MYGVVSHMLYVVVLHMLYGVVSHMLYGVVLHTLYGVVLHILYGVVLHICNAVSLLGLLVCGRVWVFLLHFLPSMYDTELKGSLRQNELLGYGIALFQGLSNIAINGAHMYE